MGGVAGDPGHLVRGPGVERGEVAGGEDIQQLAVPLGSQVLNGGGAGGEVPGSLGDVLTAASVVVVDTERRIATGEIPVGPDPGALAAAPDGHRLYVSGRDAVTVVDTDHDVVVDSVPLAAGHTGAGGIAVSGDGRRVCVARWDSVSVLDTATGKVTIPLRLGTFTGTSEIAAGVAVTPDGRQAYVAGRGVAVVDLDDLSYR